MLKFSAGENEITRLKAPLSLSTAYQISRTEGYFAADHHNCVEVTSPGWGFSLFGLFKPGHRDTITVVQGDGYPLTPHVGRIRRYRAALAKDGGGGGGGRLGERPPQERLQEVAFMTVGTEPLKSGPNAPMIWAVTFGFLGLVCLFAYQLIVTQGANAIQATQNIGITGGG